MIMTVKHKSRRRLVTLVIRFDARVECERHKKSSIEESLSNETDGQLLIIFIITTHIDTKLMI